MSRTRIRPDKQIQSAPGLGYVLHSDNNGELQFALLSALTGNSGSGSDFTIGDIRSIDSLQLLSNNLIIRYTNNQGAQFIKTCDLSSLAVDVKITDAILKRPDANTYILQLTESNGSTFSVNLSELLAIVTLDSADIQLKGKGTPSDPLTATVSDALKHFLSTDNHWTDEFIGLTTGYAVQLSKTPLQPFPIHVYRNGLRQKETIEWRLENTPGESGTNTSTIFFTNEGFGVNAQPETVIVDYRVMNIAVHS